MHDSHIWLSITKYNRIINSFESLENCHVMKLDHFESYLWFCNKWKPTYDSWFFSLAKQHNKMDEHVQLQVRFKRLSKKTVKILTWMIPINKKLASCCLVAQLCPTLYDPTDCSPPGSSVHGDSPGKKTGVGYHTLSSRAGVLWFMGSQRVEHDWASDLICISEKLYIKTMQKYFIYIKLA